MEEIDMMKMIEQAAALSKMMNPEESGNQESSFKKMAAMMEVMKMMKAMQPASPPQKSNATLRNDRPVPLAFYDDSSQNSSMQTIKAAIPHLDYKYQKNLGMMVKLLELQKLLEMYNDRIIALEGQGGANWRKGMLYSIRPHVPPEKQSMLDLLIKMIDMKEIMENMRQLQAYAATPERG